MRIDVVTIFPGFFDVLEVSLIGKARERGVASSMSAFTIFASGRMTVTAPSMTRPTGVAPGWS